jgi:hypothetical protein
MPREGFALTAVSGVPGPEIVVNGYAMPNVLGDRSVRRMASKWARIGNGILHGVPISDRIRIAPLLERSWGGEWYRRPPGVNSGTWVCYGNVVWIRLGSPESWPGEDMDAMMIKPVEP